MKILLHICCAPCSIYPIQQLRQEAIDVMGFFYRRNIHPWKECEKREETLRLYAETLSLKVIYQEGYDMETFVQNVAFREKNRCLYCYHDRLKTTALLARRGRFDGFSSTLLYSKFQQHDVIRETGEAIAKLTGMPFLYRDFRVGWKEGVIQSKELGMYRQPYCGCIYSEKERYYRG